MRAQRGRGDDGEWAHTFQFPGDILVPEQSMHQLTVGHILCHTIAKRPFRDVIALFFSHHVQKRRQQNGLELQSILEPFWASPVQRENKMGWNSDPFCLGLHRWHTLHRNFSTTPEPSRNHAHALTVPPETRQHVATNDDDWKV